MTDVALESEPLVVDQFTRVPTGTMFPEASTTLAVNVAEDMPLAGKVETEDNTLITFAVVLSDVKFTFTTELPAVVPAVTEAETGVELFSVLVALPCASVVDVGLPRVPPVVVQLIVTPAGTLLPLLSITVATKLLSATPFATTVLGVATTDETCADERLDVKLINLFRAAPATERAVIVV